MIYVYTGVIAILLFIQLRKIMSNQAQTLAILQAALAQVQKIGDETKTLLVKVDELQAALNNAGNNTPEVETALQALKDQLQVVDDLVPDVASTAEELGTVTPATGEEAQG